MAQTYSTFSSTSRAHNTSKLTLSGYVFFIQENDGTNMDMFPKIGHLQRICELKMVNC